MKILKWFRIFFLCLPKVIWDYFSYILPYSKKKDSIPLEERYRRVRKTVIFVLKKTKMHIDFSGAEKIGQGSPKLYICNHTNFIDPLLMIAFNPRPMGVVAKKEVTKIPVAGKLLALIDGIFIDRDDPISTLRQFRDASKRFSGKMMDWLIFPEGTRNRFPYGVMNPFHAGTFKFATMGKLNVVPMYMFGQHRLFDSVWFRNYPVQIKVFDEIPYERISEEGTTQFAGRMYGLINCEVQQAIENDRVYREEGKMKKKVKRWYTLSPMKELVGYGKKK